MMPPKRRSRRPERRRMERADARLSMRLETPRDEGAGGHVVTESQNISASGVYCRSSHYLAPLSKVDLTIVLPGLPGAKSAKELIKCEGIVVRCEPSTGRKADRGYELACMFSSLDERRKQRLDEFVTWRNLQALRAAASAVNGRAKPASAAKRPRLKPARAGNGAARPARAKRTGTSPARSRRALPRAARPAARSRRTIH